MIISGRKSSPDSRDLPYVSRRAGLLNVPVPRQFDRSGALPSAYDQGPVGTCESHAGAELLYTLYNGFVASRLAIHYAGRKLEHTLHQDVGIETRDLMKVLQGGVIPEAEWPYDLTQIDVPPPPGSNRRMIGTYRRLRGVSDVVDYISHEGCVVLAFEVPDTFMFRADFPAVGQPFTSEGWHCVLAAGYDLDRPRPSAWCLNSWGELWNEHGWFWLPLDWATSPDTGDDLWGAHLAPPNTVAGVTIEGA